MAHIFISYAHDDADFVRILQQELEKMGFEVWVDVERLSGGEDWRQSIDNAIRGAFVLIVVMSPAADGSKYVTYEWACAFGMGKPIIPILLKKIELHPRLQVLQYLNFIDPHHRMWEKLKATLTKIKKSRISQEVVPATSDDSGQYQGVDELISDLRGSKGETRRNAAKLLGHLEYKKAIPALLDVLDDESWLVREQVAKALGNICDKSTTVHLLRRFHRERSSHVRLAIVKALVAIPNFESIKSRELPCCRKKSSGNGTVKSLVRTQVIIGVKPVFGNGTHLL